MTKPIESSWWKIPAPKQEDLTKIESNQLAQHPVFWKFTITATWDYTMNIWFIPSFIEILSFESWQITSSQSIVKSDYNICKAVDSSSLCTEPALNTVVYLSRWWITSATIKEYWKKVKINCSSYTHSAIIHWKAYP